MKGLVRFWGSDIKKIREKLNLLWLEAQKTETQNRVIINELLDIVTHLLNKGRADEKTGSDTQ